MQTSSFTVVLTKNNTKYVKKLYTLQVESSWRAIGKRLKGSRAYSTYRGIPVQKESLKIKELINEL